MKVLQTPWGLALVVLLTRLPFLSPGFGLQPDGWRVGLAARAMWASGGYVASRYGANPLHELLAALLLPGLPLALNFVSALSAALLAVVVAEGLRPTAPHLAPWAGWASVSWPIVWVESVASKDYLLGAMLLAAAVLAAHRRRPVLAGVALGLALGVRLPLVVAAPAGLLAHPEPFSVPARRDHVVGVVTTALVGLLALSPSLWTYGFALLKSDVLFPFAWTKLMRQMVQAFGLVGGFGLALGLMGALRARRSALTWAAAWVAGAHALLYAVNPGSAIASYVIPAAPFLMWLVAPGVFGRLAVGTALLSAVLLGVSSPGPLRTTSLPLDVAVPLGSGQVALHPFAGRIFQDAYLRREEASQLDAAEAALAALPPEGRVLAGPWRPKLSWQTSDPRVVYTLDSACPTPLLAMPGAVEWNRRLRGRDCPSRPIELEKDRRPVETSATGPSKGGTAGTPKENPDESNDADPRDP